MPDLHLTEQGDIAVDHNGDLAMTDTPWRNYSQQAYIRLMTQLGDFILYADIGAELDKLIGMPQSKETGDYGRTLVHNALIRDGSFVGVPIEVRAVPVSMQAVRFDVYITAGSRTDMILQIEQNLGIE